MSAGCDVTIRILVMANAGIELESAIIVDQQYSDIGFHAPDRQRVDVTTGMPNRP